jgi:hypothetical protein
MRAFVIQPNAVSEVWFYPWDESGLANYFDHDQDRWRTTPRSAITQLRLITTPFDWVSQQPEAISIESAEAVKINMIR